MFQRLKQHLQQSFYGNGVVTGSNGNGNTNSSANASPVVRRAHVHPNAANSDQHSELNASDSGSSCGASPLNTWYFRPVGRHGFENTSAIELLCAQQIALDVVGHAFLPFDVPAPTWCDHCADFIWGIYRASQRCKYCNYTCHSRCMRSIEFPCPGNPQVLVTPSSSTLGISASCTSNSTATPPKSVPMSLPIEDHASKRMGNKQLASVLDAPFDDDSLKSPLGVGPSGNDSSPDASSASASGFDADSLHRVRSSESTATNQDDESSRFLLSSPSGPSTSDEDSANSGSPPPNSVGQVPAYAFTSLDKWSVRRFRIRVNEVQASTSAKVDNKAEADDAEAENWLNDVTVPECGTAVGLPARSQQAIADACNLSLPIGLSRCDYKHLMDEPCPAKQVCNDSDSIQTAREIPDASTESNNGTDAEIGWLIDAQRNDSLESCLALFGQNEIGFTARRLAEEASMVRENLMTLNGAIRVYINLIRPIKMALSARPLTIYDLLSAGVSNNGVSESQGKDEQLETFLLPRGTTRILHISSVTTTAQLICCLLRKFHIRDNPRKFALYEHTIESEHDVTIRKFGDHEQPLLTCLRWTLDAALDHDAFLALLTKKRIVLQENESGDIDWDAFSAPELNNFLLILQREEEDRLREIKHKYRLIKREFQRVLKENVAAQQRAEIDDGALHDRAE